MKTNLKRSLNGLQSYALPVSQLSKIKGGNDANSTVTDSTAGTVNLIIEDTVDL